MSSFTQFLQRLNPLAESLLAGVIGLAIGAVIMLGFGYNPAVAYASLFSGSFGSVYSWAESLANATPLILTALTFAIAMRGGLFNIGAEGQLYIGALAAVTVSLIHLPPPLHIIVALAAAMIAGMLWSLPVALLKTTRGVHEVISTIMFNWIAHFFAFYLIANVLTDPKRGEKTISIAETSRLGRILPDASLNYGLVVALVAVVVVLFLLWRTTAGFELRATGYNPESANYAGISWRKQVLRAFLIGGAVAGLAGAVQVMGRPPTYAVLSGMPQLLNLGFDGIGVAMIGRNHPVGIVFAAIFFGGLMVGGRIMQFSPGVPLELVRVVEGVIILALAVPELKRMFSFLRTKIKGRG
ncbi:MAG: ABC transporter permease [Arenicellales bacterium]|nr:ABC transporter permease [Arenicellales bacterium]MDP6314410.1 ABC transporter permease [Arenicellales bacterium]MDP7119715.1 ABC transporter permease [Arenicellales bacterium]MDP7192706.1 ABC transporter permease [Arenicellales bacterium]MDP7564299.1 ABC transporter permease [Arenicellales bacterium]